MRRKGLGMLIVCGFAMLSSAFAQDYTRFNKNLREAEELYNRARYRSSLPLLDTHARDALSLFLIGRDYYMLGDFKKAGEYLKKAAIAEPEASEYLDWLGRAYARRSETSNPLSGIVLAKKATEAFERAVQLNPRNEEALSDLFYCYLNTPAVLGGGHDKAAKIAEKTNAVNPLQASSECFALSQRPHPFRTDEQPSLTIERVGALILHSANNSDVRCAELGAEASACRR